MTPFADKLQASIERSRSFIVAGIDPKLEELPAYILERARHKDSLEERIYWALLDFYGPAIEQLAGAISAVKPNIAFFEQYGLAGIKAYRDLVGLAKNHGLPVIADAKRGDIGNTAAAYSAAFLGKTKAFNTEFSVFDADAVTVSPFLGFDTLEPFIKDCQQCGKGIFVLVKTSNPGSAAIQAQVVEGKKTVSDLIALWLAEKGAELIGRCGYSGLGAVVGATFPEEARQLRALMPANFFLIPGMGAQGGSAKDAVAGFSGLGSGPMRGASIINLSRGLFSTKGLTDLTPETWASELSQRAAAFNADILQAVA